MISCTLNVNVAHLKMGDGTVILNKSKSLMLYFLSVNILTTFLH